jgi:serine/threonine-protein kinase
MGEVYRARDTRLERTVAIKILPEQLSQDPVRKQRFEREAKTISNLNHPHICVLYDVGHQDGIDYLVMECVEGETLAKRLEKGPLALEQVLKYGAQIADALDRAHRTGVVHRDLKPGNIMLTSTGAKLLDFGLAKPVTPPVSLATLTATKQESPVTQEGTIVGTFQYMSPEQVEGKELDGRSDIFSLGAVLYEMLTGQRAFQGKSQLSVASAILEKEPAPVSSFKPLTPPALDQAIHRCLAKDPEERWQTARDLALELKWIAEGVSQASVVRPPAALRKLRERVAWALVAVGFVLGTVGAAFIGWHFRPATGTKTVSRFAFTIPAPREQSAVWVVGGFPLSDFPDVAISRDGTEIAYLASDGKTTRVFLRPIDSLEASPLAGTQGALTPFFSPDGQWIGFFADGKLKKVSTHGGEPAVLCEAQMNRGASWGPDDVITFAPTLFGGLMRVSAAGGSSELVASPDASKGERSYRWPEILPGGKAVVFVIAEAKDVGFFTQSKIAVERLDTHERKILPVQGTYPHYSPSGHLLFAREGRVFAVQFDVNRLEVTGQPVPVLDGVKTSPNSGVASFMVSDSGSLVYLPQSDSAGEGSLVWVDRRNQVQALGAPLRRYSSPKISPDGHRVALAIFSGNNVDIWVYEIPHRTLTRLTFGERSVGPLWSVDGKRITFRGTRGAGSDIYWKPADGSGAEETLTSGPSLIQVPTSWSPDGKFLTYWTVGLETGRDIWILPLEGERKPRPFLQTKFDELDPKFSPDGRWIAYTSNESGQFEVYVQLFPGPSGKWQISTDGGSNPVWERNGRELFYLSATKIMGVSVTAQPAFSASLPRPVADIPPSLMTALANSVYDVSPDGQRFLFVKANTETGPPEEARVVLNWTEELKRLTSPSK